MNRVVLNGLAAATFVLLAVPATAGAAAIDQARVGMAGDDVTVTLHGTSDLRPVRTRVSAGLVRLWFSDMGDSVALDHRGGDTGVQWLRVRSGANGTGLVQLSFADPRLLDATAVRMEVHGDTVKLRIARSLLPGAPAAAPAAPAAEEAAPTALAAAAPADGLPADVAALVAATPALAPPAAPVETAPAADAPIAAPADTQAAPAAAAPVAPARAASPVAAATPGNGAVKASTRHRAPRPFAAAAKPVSKGPGIIVLVFLGVLCAGTYIALRFLSKRRTLKAPVPDVQVLSARRLGPKHQLVIVRAFGRDMLLSVGNGTTQRIASVRSGGSLSISDAAMGPRTGGGGGGGGLRHTAFEESRAFSRGDMSRADISRSDISRSDISRSDISRSEISAPWAPGKMLNREISDSRDDVPNPATGTFGRELIEAARSIGRRATAPAPRAAMAGGSDMPANDSISGLLRLRELREQAAK